MVGLSEKNERARSRERRVRRRVRERSPHRESTHNRKARKVPRRRSRDERLPTRPSLPTARSNGAQNRREAGGDRRKNVERNKTRDHGGVKDLRLRLDAQRRKRSPRGHADVKPSRRHRQDSPSKSAKRSSDRKSSLDRSRCHCRREVNRCCNSQDMTRQEKGDQKRRAGDYHQKRQVKIKGPKSQKKQKVKVHRPPVRPQDKKRVVILGHSLIRNLYNLITDHPNNKQVASFPLKTDFDLQEVTCKWKYRTGMQVRDLGKKEFDMIAQDKPRLLYLHLADNDLGTLDFPKKVAKTIIDVAKGIVECPGSSIQLIIISKAFPRERATRFMDVSVVRFNEKVDAFNTFLEEELMTKWGKGSRKVEPRSFKNPKIWVWDHRRFGPRVNLHPDGIHLSEEGLRALYYSLRGLLHIALQPEWNV
jgi:hypothetical protein